MSKDQSSLLVSRDAGVSWEKQTLPSSSFELEYDLLFSPVRAADMVLFSRSTHKVRVHVRTCDRLATRCVVIGWLHGVL